MDNANVLNNITNLFSTEVVSSQSLILNLLVAFLLSLVVMFHYKKFSTILSNKESILSVIPFLILTITLIISIVKSSLALSLGLVGALSIVRFRTPIKEPEELAYLFISIAIGLGLGANQTLNTIIASLIILLIMSFIKKRMNLSILSKDYYLSIDIDNNNLEGELSNITKIVSENCKKADMRRYQISDDFCSIVFFIDIEDLKQLNDITQQLKEKYKGINVAFVDQSKIPTI